MNMYNIGSGTVAEAIVYQTMMIHPFVAERKGKKIVYILLMATLSKNGKRFLNFQKLGEQE